MSSKAISQEGNRDGWSPAFEEHLAGSELSGICLEEMGKVLFSNLTFDEETTQTLAMECDRMIHSHPSASISELVFAYGTQTIFLLRRKKLVLIALANANPDYGTVMPLCRTVLRSATEELSEEAAHAKVVPIQPKPKVNPGASLRERLNTTASEEPASSEDSYGMTTKISETLSDQSYPKMGRTRERNPSEANSLSEEETSKIWKESVLEKPIKPGLPPRRGEDETEEEEPAQKTSNSPSTASTAAKSKPAKEKDSPQGSISSRLELTQKIYLPGGAETDEPALRMRLKYFQHCLLQLIAKILGQGQATTLLNKDLDESNWTEVDDLPKTREEYSQLAQGITARIRNKLSRRAIDQEVEELLTEVFKK